MKPHLVVCSSNAGKVREIREFCTALTLPIYGLSDLNIPHQPVIEDGLTFEENAIKKVTPWPEAPNRYYLSDDSGLEVDALNGAPGIYSARFGGPGLTSLEQCTKLLQEMHHHTNRNAQFSCVLALRFPNGTVQTFSGVVTGQLTTSICGKNGFGYDPIFIPTGQTKTFGELDHSIKTQLSHRARAFEKMLTLFPPTI